MTISTRSLPLVAAVCLGFALSSCTAQSQPTPSPSPSPSAAAPAASEPAEAPMGVECSDILSSDGNAKLAADGLAPREPRVVDPLAMEMTEAGALACTWVKPSTDIQLTVVQLPVPEAEWAQWETALADAGFSDSSGSGVVYTGPVEPGSGISPVVVVRGDRITFVSTPAYAELLASHTI